MRYRFGTLIFVLSPSEVTQSKFCKPVYVTGDNNLGAMSPAMGNELESCESSFNVRHLASTAWRMSPCSLTRHILTLLYVVAQAVAL